MCNKQHLAEKICELEKIKWSCTRSLTKYRAVNDVENTTKTERKKESVKAILHNLYLQLYQADENVEIIPTNVSQETHYKHTDEEISAILNFNNDKRFTITE